jgi:hypothetical protein
MGLSHGGLLTRMPELPADLLARAIAHVPSDPDVRQCWDFVVKAIKVGWLDDDEIGELVEHLHARRDFGVEELLFAHIGDLLRVSFLDDRATCSPSMMAADLEALVRSS